MKIVKFKKDHVAGFSKGDVRELDETLIGSLKGYTESATKKELEAHLEELAARKPDASEYEKRKAEANQNTTECEDCGGAVSEGEDCEGCNDKDGGTEKVYHILTQEDIDANEKAAEGLEVGDEVELNAEGELVVGEDEKLVKKTEGND